MDEAVNLARWKAAAACCALVAASAGAQALSDPTRPPAAFRAHGAGTSAPAAAVVPDAPRLQSILIARSEGGRHVAVIDGVTVRLGDSFKGARVERMTHTEVVLSKGGRKQVLKLFPATPAGKGEQPVQPK
ncbi:MAG: hypothetical protein ACXWU9_06365 [Telluria sp.]